MVHNVVVDTPFGVWSVQVREINSPKKASEAAVNFVLKRDSRLSLNVVKVR